MPATNPPPAPPTYKRSDLYTALGSWQSWYILMYLAKGEGYATLSDIKALLQTSGSAAGKQLDRLIEVGIITKGTNRIYKLRPGLQPDRTVPVLDFGHCLLRLDHSDPE